MDVERVTLWERVQSLLPFVCSISLSESNEGESTLSSNFDVDGKRENSLGERTRIFEEADFRG